MIMNNMSLILQVTRRSTNIEPYPGHGQDQGQGAEGTRGSDSTTLTG